MITYWAIKQVSGDIKKGIRLAAGSFIDQLLLRVPEGTAVGVEAVGAAWGQQEQDVWVKVTRESGLRHRVFENDTSLEG